MGQDFDRAMTAFSWSNPYPWPRKPLLAQNVVATSQPLAAVVLTVTIGATSIRICRMSEGGKLFGG
jgi:hypothetical protein